MRLSHTRMPRPGRSGRTEGNTDTLPLVPPEVTRPAAKEGEGDPVFVDSTGRRGLRLRRLAYAAGALCAAYTGVLVLSFMGATPFAPRTVLPVPGLPSEQPGTVGETPGEEAPGASVEPGSGSASVSPSDVPVPSGSRTAPVSGGRSSAPVTRPAPTGGTSPTGSPRSSPATVPASPGTSPAASGSSSGTTPTTSATPTDRVSGTGQLGSGSPATGSPGTGETTLSGGASATTGAPSGT